MDLRDALIEAFRCSASTDPTTLAEIALEVIERWTADEPEERPTA